MRHCRQRKSRGEMALKAKPREAGTRAAEATVPHDSGEVSGQYELDEN